MTGQPVLEWHTFTPAECSRILELNGNILKRSISWSRVELYAKQMSDGEWQLNGEPVILNGDELGNGFHRLSACVLADVPFVSAVVRGVTRAGLDVVDTGRPRSPGDTLRLNGIESGVAAAAIVRLYITANNDKIGNTNWVNATLTRPMLVTFALEHREILRDANLHGSRMRAAGFSAAGPGAMWLLMALPTKDRLDDYAEFAARVIDGIGLEGGAPALALRNWIVGRSSRGTNGGVQLSAIIRAWNVYNAGGSLTTIRPWQPGGGPFPKATK